MIVVTGAAGFIGCNLMLGLNAQGRTDIIAVDDLTDGHKFKNLAAAQYADYMDQDDFIHQILSGEPFEKPIDAIFHQGACSTTTEWNGHYMMKNNYDYPKILLNYATQHQIPFIYASSAAVYGADTTFCDDDDTMQQPLNVYGYSKWMFDCYVKQRWQSFTAPVVGLRYFNVFGPHENHKGSMASVAFHLMSQLRDNNTVKLFEGHDGYDNGEQRRDFVYIKDVVAVNLWCWQNNISGIYNCGTGVSRTFNDIATTLISLNNSGSLQYIPFPEHLKGAYQSFTQANMARLHQAGYQAPMTTLEQGLEQYYDWFHQRITAEALY